MCATKVRPIVQTAVKNKNVVSLFSGCGGLDLGFTKVGFNITWANDNDKDIRETYKRNHRNTYLDERSITDIRSDEIPDCIGIIGGPPCQSWSEAGAQRGINDHRGRLFWEYVRILRDKNPLFFLAENVSGILAFKHQEALSRLVNEFAEAGFTLSIKLLNAHDYNVPQTRKRVIIVGYNKKLGRGFNFPSPLRRKLFLKDAIWDLRDNALPALENNKTNGEKCHVPNHEFMIGGFSTIYMSRNRVHSWGEPSYTIQAGGRHAPIHPQAPKMILVGKDKRIFNQEYLHLYRRLSVRECARIQTFPDDFGFHYTGLSTGYKMVGNAVPVNLSNILAKAIYDDIVENKRDNGNREEWNQNTVSIQQSLALS